MPRHRSSTKARALAALLVLISVFPGRGLGATAPVPLSSVISAQPIPLQLEVFINDRPAKLIGSFVQLPDKHIGAKRSELIDIGLKVAGSGDPDQIIALDSLTSLTYRYDETAQTIHLIVPDDLRAERNYDARGAEHESVPVQSGIGAVLNYNLFSSALTPFDKPNVSFQGLSASLDGRVFSPLGSVTQSGILGSTTFKKANALRLETAWSYSDPDTLLTYRAGDAITSGLAWTRPIRIGGAQIQRNFGLRSDLVTLPLPSVSGSAAVPSTLDVYLNNVKTFTQEVDAGPYRINNLPLLSGDGTARVVLHDSAGHEIESTLPFFTTAKLLKPGLMDYSAEAGLPRLFYGVKSDDYSMTAVGSASMRAGVTDWLTAEGHAEGGAGVENGGLGAVTRVGPFGLLSTALSASHYRSQWGGQAFAGFETQLFGVNINLSTQRAVGHYADLASATARTSTQNSLGDLSQPADWFVLSSSILPPRALDRVALSIPLPFDKSSIGVTYTRLHSSDGKRSQIASISYSRNLLFGATGYVSAYTDVENQRDFGIFFGLSVPLGSYGSAGTGTSFGRKQWATTLDAMRPLGSEIGSYGWRIRDAEANAGSARSAAMSYRSPWGRVEAGLGQGSSNAQGTVEVDGAIATMGGGVFLTNRIDDAFAVVDAGAPGVDVLYENKKVGVTDGGGKILIPNLRSYQRNAIAIDPRNLPVDSDINTTQDVVAPAAHSGVLVKFGVKTNVSGAVVVLNGSDGKPLQAGRQGKLAGSEQAFVVGYEGRAYITGLSAQNAVSVSDIKGGRTARPHSTSRRRRASKRQSVRSCASDRSERPGTGLRITLRQAGSSACGSLVGSGSKICGGGRGDRSLQVLPPHSTYERRWPAMPLVVSAVLQSSD